MQLLTWPHRPRDPFDPFTRTLKFRHKSASQQYSMVECTRAGGFSLRTAQGVIANHRVAAANLGVPVLQCCAAALLRSAATSVLDERRACIHSP